MVRAEAEPVVFQVEAAAPIRFKLPVAVMLSVLITRVLPMVAVAAYMLAHFNAEEPILYVAV